MACLPNVNSSITVISKVNKIHENELILRTDFKTALKVAIKHL